MIWRIVLVAVFFMDVRNWPQIQWVFLVVFLSVLAGIVMLVTSGIMRLWRRHAVKIRGL